MGVNQQTSVPAFTSGQVLTAQQQTEINTGVPVFADTTARNAAFGGTGEKTLAEGQLAYLEDSDIVQYYDGASWQSVGVTPGLVVVKTETAFSAVSTFEADSVFSSSYTNYKMFIRYQTSSTGDIYARFRVAGVSASGANYNSQQVLGVSTSAQANRETSQTSMYIGDDSNGAFWSTIELNIFAPNLAEPTTATSICNRSNGAYTTTIIQLFGTNHTLATAYDGIQILLGGGTITGSYTIYGYGKTV
jgi:hypothetical protein